MFNRPFPPGDLWERGPEAFVPDFALARWLEATFINAGGPLYNPEHNHLGQATLGVLWTNAHNSKGGMVIAGTAEMPNVSGNRWCKARSRVQIEGWFGDVPTFIITLDAVLSAEASDSAFCALVEHELYHCGQERDDYGSPKYDREGSPVFGMRSHDVEEFVGIVERYGARGVLNPKVLEMVEAARSSESVVRGVRLACGVCAGVV